MKVRRAIVSLAAVLMLSACQRPEAPAHEEVRPVRTLVAGRSEGTVDSKFSGELVARYESQLGFRVAGKVAARLVEVGSAVKRGQALLRLNPEQEALNLVAATADAQAAKSRVDQARIDLQRTEQLLAKNYASRAEFDQQKLALDQAEAQWRAAQAQRDAVANQRDYTVLSADRDGVVTAIHVEVGQVVGAGQVVVKVAADGEREVVISVPESRVDELRQARALQVSVWAHPGRTWAGRLRELAPATDSVTRTYAARIAIREPDPKLLRLGMTASVAVKDVEGSSAIRLPLTAIVDKAGQRQVWVVDPKSSRVALRQVSLGSPQGDSVLVLAGLQGGETVVTAGVHLLQPGQRVKLPATAASGAGQ